MFFINAKFQIPSKIQMAFLDHFPQIPPKIKAPSLEGPLSILEIGRRGPGT